MKRIAMVLVAAAAAVLSGCSLLPIVRGSGIPASASFDVGSFTRIAATQACVVTIVPDAVPSLEVTVDDNLLPYLDVRNNGSASVLVGLKQGYAYAGTTFRAEVHVPVLAALDLSGASRATVRPGFASALPLSVTLSGASEVSLQAVACGDLTADISGASSLTAAGTAARETIRLSGASQAHLQDLPAAAARLDLSGASECWVNIGSGPLVLAASGASTVHYRGAPALTIVDLSGLSRVVREY